MTEGILIERKTRGEQPPPGVKGPGAADAPHDRGNTATTQPGSEPQTAPGVTGKQEHAETEPSKESSADVEQAQKRSGIATNGSTLDTTPKSSGKEAKRLPSLERDVSPGTMPDGSHAQTSGDRGESYTPTTLSKLKSKLHIGGGK